MKTDEYFINTEPYYQPIGDEIDVFEAAYKQNLPILLKGLLVVESPALWNTWRGD